MGVGARGKYLNQLHTLFASSIRIQAEEREQERKEGEEEKEKEEEEEEEEEEEVTTTPEPAHLRQHAQPFRADQVQVLRHGIDKLDKGLNPDPIRHLPLLVDVVACQRPQRHGRLLLQGLGVAFLQQLHQESLSAHL